LPASTALRCAQRPVEMSRQTGDIGSTSGREPAAALSTGGVSPAAGTGALPPGGGLEGGQQQVAGAFEAAQDTSKSGRPGAAAGEPLHGATQQASRPLTAAVLAEGAGTSAAGLSQSLAAAATEAAAAAAAAVAGAPEAPPRQPATRAALWGARARYLLLLCRLLLQQLLLLPERRSWQLDPLLRFRPGMPVPEALGQEEAEAEEPEGGLEAQFEQYHAAMMANKVDGCAVLLPSGGQAWQAGWAGQGRAVRVFTGAAACPPQ
jgi:hypothetical protein